jgi:hypothetical protein
VILGRLAKQHKLSLIVDEILTGGRTSVNHMLLTQEKPKTFRNQVLHITLGKWLGMGLVLTNSQALTCQDNPNLISPIFAARGLSSQPGCSNAIRLWTAVFDKRHLIHSRRAKVLLDRRLNEQQCWGIGLMIYHPHKRVSVSRGLKNRLLPLLDNVKVDTVRLTRDNKWEKSILCKMIMAGVISWVDHQHDSDGQNIADRVLCDWVCTSRPTMMFSSEQYKQENLVKYRGRVGPVGAWKIKGEFTNSLQRAAKVSLLENKLVHKKRVHRWFPHSDLNFE